MEIASLFLCLCRVHFELSNVCLVTSSLATSFEGHGGQPLNGPGLPANGFQFHLGILAEDGGQYPPAYSHKKKEGDCSEDLKPDNAGQHGEACCQTAREKYENPEPALSDEP